MAVRDGLQLGDGANERRNVTASFAKAFRFGVCDCGCPPIGSIQLFMSSREIRRTLGCGAVASFELLSGISQDVTSRQQMTTGSIRFTVHRGFFGGGERANT
jgi:hypothetical protein